MLKEAGDLYYRFITKSASEIICKVAEVKWHFFQHDVFTMPISATECTKLEPTNRIYVIRQ